MLLRHLLTTHLRTEAEAVHLNLISMLTWTPITKSDLNMELSLCLGMRVLLLKLCNGRKDASSSTLVVPWDRLEVWVALSHTRH